MSKLAVRLVLDTNTLLRSLIRADSGSAQLLRIVERREVVLLLSKSVQAEYQAVLTDSDVVKPFPHITPRQVALTIARLRYVSDYFRKTNAKFVYPRDPRNTPFIELAIEGDATHIVSYDKDLLSLPLGHDDAAKRFRRRLPATLVIKPEQFLRSI